MKVEEIILDAARDVRLTAITQAVGGEFPTILRRPVVLILPGGGYTMCSDREADPVALAYLQVGFQAVILRYGVKDPVWPQPLEDYELAMAWIAQHEEELGADKNKIVVVGFSAGGHLAAAAAVMARTRPAAAVLGYALTGADVQHYLPSAPDLCGLVGDDVCPCFLFACRKDPVVPVKNTMCFAQALEANGVAFECHIYGWGPHGFSTGDPCVLWPGMELPARAQRWVADSVAWLRETIGGWDGQD